MKYVVVGVEHSKGEFEDRQTKEKIGYDNMLLHCFVHDDSPRQRTELLNGTRTAVIKVKNDFAMYVSLNGNAVKHFSELVGCEIKPFYNRFGNVDVISVITTDGQI